MYLIAISKMKQSKHGVKAIAAASQITFSAYLIGFAVFLFMCNVQGITKQRIITGCFFHVTAVCLVNSMSIWYYNYRLSRV